MDTPKISNHLSTKDTTPKVTGIGGVFLVSENPKDMKAWYAQHLGFEMNAWGGTSFDTRDKEHPEIINTLQWTLFKQGTDYFAPSKKEWMVNYRVQNIEGFVKKLKAEGVTVLDEIVTYDFGKFVHLLDNEGNKIELWEPIDNDPKEGQKSK